MRMFGLLFLWTAPLGFFVSLSVPSAFASTLFRAVVSFPLQLFDWLRSRRLLISRRDIETMFGSVCGNHFMTLWNLVCSVYQVGLWTVSFESEAIFVIVQTFAASTSLVVCLLYTSPSPRDKRQSRMPSSA